MLSYTQPTWQRHTIVDLMRVVVSYPTQLPHSLRADAIIQAEIARTNNQSDQSKRRERDRVDLSIDFN